MNNPFVDALGSIKDNFYGIGRGTNPLFAPQAAELFGFNIPAVPIVSVRDYFLFQMESWFTSIPMSTQWIVVIDQYPKALNQTIVQALERTDASRRGFNINNAVTILKSFPMQKIIGCLFAHNVTIPTESFEASTVSVNNNRGFLPGVIGGARNSEVPTLVIDFKETNTSFIDNVIRPWVILGSHFGMVARPNDTPISRDLRNMKVNMTLLSYTRSIHNISMIPRKVFTFYNCMPFNVSEQTYEYENEKLVTYSTRWTYSNYTVENSLYLPVTDVINRISQGEIPRITTLQNGIGSIDPLGML